MQITTNPWSVAAGPEDPEAPTRRSGPRVWAGAVLLLGGLAMILLAGCFEIGALILLRPQLLDPKLTPDALSSEAYFLLVTLQVTGVLCLLLALVLLFLGVRGLTHVLQET